MNRDLPPMFLRPDLGSMPSSGVDTRLRGHDTSFYPGHTKNPDSQIHNHIAHRLPRFHGAVCFGNLAQCETRPDAVLQLVFREHV
jgi:hypothetical protein